jgi:hypothetical protein
VDHVIFVILRMNAAGLLVVVLDTPRVGPSFGLRVWLQFNGVSPTPGIETLIENRSF